MNICVNTCWVNGMHVLIEIYIRHNTLQHTSPKPLLFSTNTLNHQYIYIKVILFNTSLLRYHQMQSKIKFNILLFFVHFTSYEFYGAMHYSAITCVLAPQNQWQLNCLSKSLFRLTSKEISAFHITGLLKRESTSHHLIPSQRASNVECIPISWCYHCISCNQ